MMKNLIIEMNHEIYMYGFLVINLLKMAHFLNPIMLILFVQKSALTQFKEHIPNNQLPEDIQILLCFNNILQNLNLVILYQVYQKRKVL